MGSITSIFHPILNVLGDIIAFFYSLVPDYTFAIAMLTTLIMLIISPLTLKQTRSMIQMTKLQPELKKIQTKYKGDRVKISEETMALYKENGANPMSGCLPMLIQFPILAMMYQVIRGMLYTVTTKVHGVTIKTVKPKYISPSSLLYQHLQKAGGTMRSIGMNLAQSPTQARHQSIVHSVPYFALLFASAGIQFIQMRQMNGRNKGMAAQNPQMQSTQRMMMIMPLVMMFLYMNFPAALSVYFCISGLFRLIQQDLMYRFDPVLVDHVKKNSSPKGLAGSSGTSTGLGNAKSGALPAKSTTAKTPAQLGSAKPGGAKPGVAKPGVAKPGTAKPGAKSPAKSGPANSKSGAAKATPNSGGKQAGQGATDATASDEDSGTPTFPVKPAAKSGGNDAVKPGSAKYADIKAAGDKSDASISSVANSGKAKEASSTADDDVEFDANSDYGEDEPTSPAEKNGDSSATNGSRGRKNRSSLWDRANRSVATTTDDDDEDEVEDQEIKVHPRSKAKRPRKPR